MIKEFGPARTAASCRNRFLRKNEAATPLPPAVPAAVPAAKRRVAYERTVAFPQQHGGKEAAVDTPMRIVRAEIALPDGAKPGDNLTFITSAGTSVTRFSAVLPPSLDGGPMHKKIYVNVPVPIAFPKGGRLSICCVTLNGMSMGPTGGGGVAAGAGGDASAAVRSSSTPPAAPVAAPPARPTEEQAVADGGEGGDGGQGVTPANRVRLPPKKRRRG
jgi:hypothetical protein